MTSGVDPRTVPSHQFWNLVKVVGDGNKPVSQWPLATGWALRYRLGAPSGFPTAMKPYRMYSPEEMARPTNKQPPPKPTRSGVTYKLAPPATQPRGK